MRCAQDLRGSREREPAIIPFTNQIGVCEMLPNGGHFFAQSKGTVAREFERIEEALRQPQTDARYCQLYGAQQALAWALEPNGIATPYETIQRGLVRPLTVDTPEGSRDCQESPRPVGSSDTCARASWL
jgi:hypothetical protein